MLLLMVIATIFCTIWILVIKKMSTGKNCICLFYVIQYGHEIITPIIYIISRTKTIRTGAVGLFKAWTGKRFYPYICIPINHS